MPKFKDLTGKKFGRLFVIKCAGTRFSGNKKDFSGNVFVTAEKQKTFAEINWYQVIQLPVVAD